MSSGVNDANERATSIQRVARGWLSRQRCAFLARDVYRQGWDPTHERVYFWNTKTGYVSWTRPPLLRDQAPLVVDAAAAESSSVQPHDDPTMPPTLISQSPTTPTASRRDQDDGKQFLNLCTEEKRHLFQAHRRKVMRSMHRWELHQLEGKAKARADRLARIQAENQERLTDLQQGARAYNLKSIRQAAVQGDVGRITELLGLGFHADASSAMGLTPLLGACQSGCVDAVRVLLQHGADPNLQHVKTKRTPLMEASGRESHEVVRELLRYGARLDLKDAHGESAFDCVQDPTIRQHLELAASTWSVQNAELFPIPFREAGRTLLLVQRRQQNVFNERRIAMRRDLSTLQPTFQRAAAEAKMRYDGSVRASHAQVTLLKKVDVLNRADAQFDEDRTQLLIQVDHALRAQAEAERPRVLPASSISTILSLCGRHWFDPPVGQVERRKHQRRARRQFTEPVKPVGARVGLHVLPPSLVEEWNQFQLNLLEQCDELRLLQAKEHSDVENGVTRTNDGQTLARLSVVVHEAQHLPFRDPRLHEPIDPLVRIMLRSQQFGNSAALSTDIRLADRHPTWGEAFNITVESVKSELVVHIVDSKRKEIAGEVVVSLRTLLDQKEHDEWFVLPPTLRQQAMEKKPREHAARVRLTLRLIHTESILVTRQIQQSLVKRTQVLSRRRAFMQSVLDDCMRKLGEK